MRRAVSRTEIIAGRNRFEQAGVLIPGVGGNHLGARCRRQIKGRLLHSQWIEEALLEKDIECLSAQDLNNPARGIEATLTVTPLGAGLKLHGRGHPKRNQIRQRAGFLRGRSAGFSKTRGVRENLGDCKIGGLS